MPGPQGPEVNETITGDKASVVDKADVPATEIGAKEPPRTSPIDNSTTNSAVNTGANNNGSTTAKTTTTSNQTRRVAGFRYYRDLGQN